jgi:hypothetical protein
MVLGHGLDGNAGGGFDGMPVYPGADGWEGDGLYPVFLRHFRSATVADCQLFGLGVKKALERAFCMLVEGGGLFDFLG